MKSEGHKKIILLSDGTGPNKGEQSILFAITEELKKHSAKHEVFVFSLAWNPWRAIKETYKFFCCMRRADLFIQAGGHPIQDKTSIIFLIFGLYKVLIAYWLKKPIFYWGIGVGPLETRLGKILTKMIVNRTNFIVVRDAESKAFLKTAGIIRPPIYVAADPTLTLPTSDFETIKEVLRQECLDGQAPMVAIAPRRWFHYVHSIIPVKYIAKYKLWKLKGTERFEALKGILAKISDYLIESYKVKIVFVPMRMANGDIHPGQDDDRVCGEIMDIMKHRENVTMLAGDYSPCELKGFLGQMEMVIGMRMHALILASSMHVPVIGISYGPKGRSYFKMIGLPEYEMDVEKVTLNWLKGTVDELWNNKDKVREHLKTVMGPLRKKAEHSTVYVTKFLK